jgi:hypothetical protein
VKVVAAVRQHYYLFDRELVSQHASRRVTVWRCDGGRWLAIMDTGYPDPPAAR